MATATESKSITIDDLRSMDVTELEREIQDLEGKLELHIQKAQSEIDGRKQLLKVVDVLKNGKPPRKKRKDAGSSKNNDTPPSRIDNPVLQQSPSGTNGNSKNGDKIAAVLQRHGKLNIDSIAKATALTELSCRTALNSDPQRRFDMDKMGLWFLV